MKRCLVVLLVVFGGCATSPEGSEASREVVLAYLNADVGTAGPFSRKGLKEFDTLSEKDQAQATTLFESGAVAFLIFTPGAADGKSAEAAGTRIVFVRHGKVVGDFRGVKKAT